MSHSVVALSCAAPVDDSAISSLDNLDNLGPITSTERLFAQVLSDVIGTARISIQAHFFNDLGADSMLMARFCARVRKHPDLPPVSMKDVYQHPTIGALAAALDSSKPATVNPTESTLARVLGDILEVDRVPPDAHFFDDLGADSMLMARFCARVRKQPGVPAVSMKDVYGHPTISGLAAALVATAVSPPEPAEPAALGTAAESPAPVTPATTLEYVVCGALQVLVFLGYSFATATALWRGYEWVSAAPSVLEIYLRSALFGGATFLAMCTFPILVKWILIGRWKRTQIRIWSLAYVRFWVVRTLVTANPLLVFFVGSPLYVLYLRALGARVGRGVVIMSRRVPTCTDLLTIGDGTVIRKDTFFTCYRAQSGVIQTGTVTLGTNVVVGDTSVLDIDTSMGEGAQLGHASSLHAGQMVPAGEHWHGSPAEPTTVNYQLVASRISRQSRKIWYSTVQVLKVLFVNLPLAIGGLAILFAQLPWLAAVASNDSDLTQWSLYRDALATSFVLTFGVTMGAVLFMSTVPRVLNLALKPDRVYPLYGFHYAVLRAISRLTNNRFLTSLTGDSSFIVHYLRSIGYRLTPVLQTGSNFGTQVKHDSPYQVSIGTGTVCASELSIVNALFSSSSFCVSRAIIGANNFLGNMIAYPAQSKTGDNCLLATKVLVPIEGPVREGVGLLGSPSFEIPRSVARDSHFERMAHGANVDGRLAAKNRHNLISIGMLLLSRWIHSFVLVVAMAGFLDLRSPLASAFSMIFMVVFTLFYAVLLERVGRGFRNLRPLHCSIYDADFWRRERFFKMTASAQVLLNGTPFKGMIWRLLGVRVGKRLFDEGYGMAEKNMVTIGDNVTLNAGSGLQCHTQEDYAFKSDNIWIGSGATVGVGALVHYGTKIGEGAVLAPDSFLMKGEEIPPHAHWGGNPARDLGGSIVGLRLTPARQSSPAVATSAD